MSFRSERYGYYLKQEKYSKKKIIGVTCHNSIKLAKIAIKHNADYVAFGAFYFSKTKKINLKQILV